MTKLFFDTEFYEDGKTIELISIGIVREDGETYYAEVPNAEEICKKSDWLVENVLPHLNPQARHTRDYIATTIQRFAGKSPEWWAAWGAYDWVVLNQLYGRMLDHPPTWPYYVRDVIQFADDFDILREELPEQTGTEHHALADALWTQQAWQFVTDLIDEGQGGAEIDIEDIR